MSSPPTLETIEVRVTNLEKKVDEFKADRKEDQKVMMDTLKSLQDNSVRQTIIMEMMEQRAEKQDQRLDKIDETLVKVNLDVQTIKTRSETKTKETEGDKPNWYQNYISSNTRFLWATLFLVLGTVLGFTVQDILAFFKILV